MDTGLLRIALEAFFLVYTATLNLAYLALDGVSFLVLRRHRQRETLSTLHNRYSTLELPVSLIIPAYNEEATIAATVRSLLQLNYSRFEIVVVNDGSTDRTLQVLQEAFGLQPFPEVVRRRIQSKDLRCVYRSPVHPELKVIDKVTAARRTHSTPVSTPHSIRCSARLMRTVCCVLTACNT